MSDRVYRLLDMVVEEVSLVDHAANRRRFLIVKRSDPMGDENVEKDAEGGETTDPENDGGATPLDAFDGPAAGEQPSTPNEAGTVDELEELVAELRAATLQLTEQLKPGSPTTERGVERPTSAALLQTLNEVRDALRALGRTESSKAAPPKRPPASDDGANSDEAAPDLRAKLTALATSVRELGAAIKAQQQRLARLEKRAGLPTSEQAGERVTKGADEDTGWPLDLNRPFDRSSVDGAVSVHSI